jgi:hypothetical protein
MNHYRGVPPLVAVGVALLLAALALLVGLLKLPPQATAQG